MTTISEERFPLHHTVFSHLYRLIEVLFEKAREHSPSIIIVDDLEYLQHTANENEDGLWKPKQQLAAQITGI